MLDFISAREKGRRVDLLLLVLLFGSAFFAFLGRLPLMEPDEARYAEIPREMLERGDFVTPFLNYVKYFEKPALHYWLNALSFSLFGQNEFAARFSTAVMAFVGLLAVYLAGRKLFGRREALLGSLILGTSVGYVVQARYNIIDMTLATCMSLSLLCFVTAATTERGKGLLYHLFWLFAALAFLAKGLIGIVLPGAIIFFWMVGTRNFRPLREMRLFTGLLLFAAVSAPWYVTVSLHNPEFARFFFIHEHFERFTTEVHKRDQPFWFFAPVLLGCMLPWSFFFPQGIRGAGGGGAEGNRRLFLAIWAVLIFVFFSLSHSKLISYILPIFPPLALLTAHYFSAWFDRGGRRRSVEGVAAFLAVLGAAVIAYPFVTTENRISAAGFAVIGVTVLVMGISVFAAARKGKAVAAFTFLALFSWTLSVTGPPFVLEGRLHRKTSRDLGSLVTRVVPPGAALACLSGYQQGIPFYTGRRVIVVGDANELTFGSRIGDQSPWFIDRPAFLRRWNSTEAVYAIINGKDLQKFRAGMLLPPRILGGEGERLLIFNGNGGQGA